MNPRDKITCLTKRVTLLTRINNSRSNCSTRALKNGDFTDFAFICEGERIAVHRVIICSQSPVFRTACIGPFKVICVALKYRHVAKHKQEASSQTYSLDSHTLPTVRRMVDYFYIGDYATELTEEDRCKGASSVLVVHAEMFALADKYAIEGLETLAAYKYERDLRRQQDAHEFFLSIPAVYELTPGSSRGLRDKVLCFARERLGRFITLAEVKEEFDSLTIEMPEFAKELLDSFLRHPMMGYCYGCGRDKLVPVMPL